MPGYTCLLPHVCCLFFHGPTTKLLFFLSLLPVDLSYLSFITYSDQV